MGNIIFMDCIIKSTLFSKNSIIKKKDQTSTGFGQIFMASDYKLYSIRTIYENLISFSGTLLNFHIKINLKSSLLLLL